MRCDLLEAIPVQLEAAGVGIPYPQRDVWVRQEADPILTKAS